MNTTNPFSSSGDRLLRLPEAAEVLRVSTKTVRRLIDAGKLASVKFAGIRLVRVSDLDGLIERASQRAA